MANPLERAATRRKVWYFAAIIGLFTASLFWRGKLPVPGSAALARAADPAGGRASAPVRAASAVVNSPIAAQATRLELRELDQGDPEIAGAAARLALIGVRGPVITGLWWTAIEKQKRGEWTQFEQAARLVTRLQPNFITPWIFQAWNIAYNVSVENDKLGDMFFYIARGIELLSEGDRLNTKTYPAADGEVRRIGSPDIRHQLGFYYQNKFGVSDKVNTLRSIMQLAVIPPADRDPKAFRAFCEKNPQLVRRLREHVFVDTDQKNPYATPDLVVGFLADNYKVPCRYEVTGARKKAEDQFPILPPAFEEGPDEYRPDSPADDSFDAFHAARAWFGYAIATTPPPKIGPGGRPIPWTTPEAGTDYDPFKYRMPKSPMYVIFRESKPQAQTKLAERLAKEGWFDSTSAWSPDERADRPWFKRSPGDADVFLKAGDSSRAEWQKAYTLWQAYGAENAMELDDSTRLNLEALAAKVPGSVGSLPSAADFPPERLAAYKLTEANLDARRSLTYYAQNRRTTNFPYFIATSGAEQDPLTVDARKLLYRAEVSKKYGANAAAIRDYAAGLAKWRQVLVKYPRFHHPEQSDDVEEKTYEYELELVKLLRGDGQVLARAAAAAAASAALLPALPELAKADFEQAAAEREAGLKVVALDPAVEEAARAEGRKAAAGRAPAAHHAALALAGVAAADAPGMSDALIAGLARAAEGGDLTRDVAAAKFDWMREFIREPLRSARGDYLPSDGDYWVRPSTRESVRTRLGLTRKPATADAAGAAAGPGG